jgi:hypothetical protein
LNSTTGGSSTEEIRVKGFLTWKNHARKHDLTRKTNWYLYSNLAA